VKEERSPKGVTLFTSRKKMKKETMWNTLLNKSFMEVEVWALENGRIVYSGK
jgi:hypothetical protein